MGQIDEIKEELNYLKVWLGILVVTAIGLIGWLFNHYGTSSNIKVLSDAGGIVVLSIAIIIIDRKIKQKIRSLKDL